ncbi:gas vesicle protein GvpO [Haladaptatus sp. NG-SE-30]
MSDQTDDASIGEFDDVIDRLTDAVEDSENDTTEHDTSEIRDTEDEIDIVDARDVGRAVAEDLTGEPLDGIVAVEGHEEGWRVVVEVVKRESIPDTQDILDRYVISLGPTSGVRGYSRAGRYRRGNLREQREIFDEEH